MDMFCIAMFGINYHTLEDECMSDNELWFKFKLCFLQFPNPNPNADPNRTITVPLRTRMGTFEDKRMNTDTDFLGKKEEGEQMLYG
jgi:hypothetical protein